MSVIDELNNIAKDSYGSVNTVYDRGAKELSNSKVNPLHSDKIANAFADLFNVIPEWVDALEQHGKKIALAAQNAYGNVPTSAFEDSIDDVAFDNPVMSAANQKLADALQESIEDARYDATKDPLILGANVATAVTGNPWLLPFVQTFDIAHQVTKAENTDGTGTKVAGENAVMLGLGIAAGGVSHGVGRALLDYAPKLARAMTTPLAGSTAGAAAVMAYDPNQREYAKEHSLRALYNFYGTDAALGVHAAIKGGNWSAKTNPTSDVANTIKANDGINPVVSLEKSSYESIIDNPTPASPIKRRGKKAYKRRKAAHDTTTKQGVTTDETMSNKVATAEETSMEMSVSETYEGMAEPRLKYRKSETMAEEAFPQNKPENQIIASQNETRFNEEHLEARRLKEFEQGAYGDKLECSTVDLYPKAVSVEDIWGTVNRISPTRVRKIADNTVNGYYVIRGKDIVSRSFRGWSTICHEVGHAVSAKLKWGTTPEIQKELFDGATSIWKHGEYGNPAAPATFLTYVEEGRAAFMNEYCVNPALAKKHFPLAFEELEKAVVTNSTLARDLKLLGQQVRRWGNSSSMEKAEGLTHYNDRWKMETVKQGLEEHLDKLEKSLSWEFAPLSNISERVVNDVMGTKLSVEENLGNIAQRSKEQLNNEVRLLYNANDYKVDTTTAIQELSDRYNIALNNVVYTDIFNPLTVGGERGKAIKEWLVKTKTSDVYGGLTQYLIARRELEIIKIKNAERIAKLTAQLKPLQEEVASLKTEFDKVRNTPSTTFEEKKSVSTRYIAAQHRLRKLENTIDAIKNGQDDYITPKTRTENAEIIRLCEQLPEMKAAANLYYLWHENMLRFAVAGGLMSEKVANGLLKNQPNYLPFRRSFEIEGFDEAMGTSKLEHLGAEGTDRVILDPLAQSVLNMKALMRRIEQNRVINAVAKLADGENGSFLMKLDADNQLPVDKAHQMVSVWRGGRRYNYQCVANGLYDALTDANKGINVIELNLLSRLLTLAPRSVRWGATSSPAFGIANAMRDILDAVVLNKDGRRSNLNVRLEPLLLLWDGLTVRFADKLGKAEALKYRNEFYSQGIQYTANLGSARKITTNIRRELNPSTWDKTTKVLSAPFRGLEAFNQMLEEIPRMGLYKRVRERQGSKFEAAHVASDGTVNFMRSGTATREANKYIPFFNATLQGTLKAARELRKDPIGFNMAVAKYVLFPTLIAYWANHDQDWYRDMPLEKKNNSWYIKLNDTIYAFPKPPLIGHVYGSLVERMLDVALMDDDAGVVRKELFSIVKNLFPSGIPSAALVPIESITNYSFFRQRPIVDSHLGKLEPSEQYTPYTSYVARKLGEFAGASPMKIDNAIYDLTSTMGYTINGIIDMIFKDNQTSAHKWTEWSRFTYTEGTSSSRSSDVFFNGMDKLEKEYNSLRTKNKNAKIDAKLKGMCDAKKKAMDLQKSIRENEENGKLTAQQKRVIRDNLVKKQNDVYRTANKKYLNYKYIQAPK